MGISSCVYRDLTLMGQGSARGVGGYPGDNQRKPLGKPLLLLSVVEILIVRITGFLQVRSRGSTAVPHHCS